MNDILNLNLETEIIETGKIVGTHGVRGELKLQSWADSPSVLFDLDHFYIDGKVFRIESLRQQNNILLLKLDGIDNLNKAELMRNKIVYAERSFFDLPEGTYFIKDLMGIEVFDADKENICYGKITDIMATGANDVYELTDDSGVKRLIPAIKDVIISTDINAKKMIIRPLLGLFNEDEQA